MTQQQQEEQSGAGCGGDAFEVRCQTGGGASVAAALAVLTASFEDEAFTTPRTITPGPLGGLLLPVVSKDDISRRLLSLQQWLPCALPPQRLMKQVRKLFHDPRPMAATRPRGGGPPPPDP